MIASSVYLVVVMLTFMDGTYAQYNNGKWDTANSLSECREKVQSQVAEMREWFKDSEVKPSTFVTECVLKES